VLKGGIYALVASASAGSAIAGWSLSTAAKNASASEKFSAYVKLPSVGAKALLHAGVGFCKHVETCAAPSQTIEFLTSRYAVCERRLQFESKRAGGEMQAFSLRSQNLYHLIVLIWAMYCARVSYT
jgi:hypothetical protein